MVALLVLQFFGSRYVSVHVFVSYENYTIVGLANLETKRNTYCVYEN